MTSKRFIFVCSGNICRSPLAAAMAKKKFDDREISVAIISAGTLGINGEAAATHSVTVAEEYGLDISHHRSQGLSRGLADLADALIVMSPRHVDAIETLGVSTRVVSLWEFGEGLTEIEDPIGRDLEAFRACAIVIDRCLDSWIERDFSD